MVEVESGPAPSEGVLARLRTASDVERNRAWRLLYDEHFRDIHRLVWRFGVEPAEVEDLAQRVFVIAYERLSEMDDVENVGGWLRGVTVRVVAAHRRWRRVRRVKEWVVRSRYGDESHTVSSPEDEVETEQRRQLVRAILERLRPKLRDVLVLCDVEGCSAQDVAAMLGVPVNTVRSRRRLAREEFERIWDKRERHG